jgi:hypothetical protein
VKQLRNTARLPSEHIALDATIRLFDPDYAVENIRPKPVPAVHKSLPGDSLRMMLALLREAKGPACIPMP